jgi:hypothetical protein
MHGGWGMAKLMALSGLVVALSAHCTISSGGAPEAQTTGPPRVDERMVARHARHLDDDLARRPAGSQQEEAAADYIRGYLQRAGYRTRLAAVPVGDAGGSRDVLAVPPSGDTPETVVAVAYDTENAHAPGGEEIGLFLELARALKVVDPRHSVEFVALGAEHAQVRGGHPGSRQLVELLIDEDHEPLVITIEAIGGEMQGRFSAFGPEVSAMTDVARQLDIPVTPLPPPDPEVGRDLAGRARVFRLAGLDHIAVAGGASEVGRVLVRSLASR